MAAAASHDPTGEHPAAARLEVLESRTGRRTQRGLARWRFARRGARRHRHIVVADRFNDLALKAKARALVIELAHNAPRTEVLHRITADL